MGTVLRLALLAGGQLLGGRQGSWLPSLALSAAAALVFVTGVAFLVSAVYLALAQHYDTPTAAAIVGGALCSLAALIAGGMLLLRRGRRPTGLVQGLLPVLAATPAMRRDSEEILLAFGRLVSTAAPATVAAALAGLLVGLVSPRARVARP